MIVKHVVKNEALGRLQLDGRTHDTANVFMNLAHLQEIIGIGSKINTILISNIGDKYDGLEIEDEAVTAIEQTLNTAIGYSDLGYELNSTDSDYLRLVNSDIFFDDNIYELVKEYSAQPSNEIFHSPIMTYFVNSISNDETNKIVNYSMITGLDEKLDSEFSGDELKITSTEGLNGQFSSLKEIQLGPDDIMLNSWTAKHLGVNYGDSVTIEYMVLDRLFNIYNTTHTFTVKYIIELEGAAIDPQLMPAFPGLEGKLDCVDWEPLFPIDYTRLLQDDRDYWINYQGTPKAFISLEIAQELWSTNLGSYTMIKLDSKLNSSGDQIELKNSISTYLDDTLEHSDAGLTIDRVKSDSLSTSSGMAIFPMMFLAFGMVIIIAGIALIVTIFLLLAEARKYDLGVGRAMGLKVHQVAKIFLIEGIIYAFISGIVGVVFGIVIGWGLVYALNTIWSASVQGFTVPFYFKPISILLGFIIGLIITLFTVIFTARYSAKRKIISLLHDIPLTTKESDKMMFKLGLALTIISALLILVIGPILAVNNVEDAFFNILYFGLPIFLIGSIFTMGYSSTTKKRKEARLKYFSLSFTIGLIIMNILFVRVSTIPVINLFFISGFYLVIFLIITAIVYFKNLTNGVNRLFRFGRKPSPVVSYALNNPMRKMSRTTLTITIFTLVIFLLVALSINIAIQQESVSAISVEERGGYDIIGETAVPISIDLENKTQREQYNVPAPVLNNLSITEIQMVGPPGGTCSNMNVRFPPRILGVDHDFVEENLFRFVEPTSAERTARSLWRGLEETASENNNRIPIVVDYNTLVWIYGGSLGKTYTVEDEFGNDVELEVIGVLENSVFGGTFVMSQGNLESIYPTTSEFRYALFKIKAGVSATPESLAADLEHELNRYGMDAQSIREFIHDNQEYEQSFMALFQAFLGLGLIIGIVGLGIISARTVQERRYEIGVLRALGFKRKMILKAFLIEPSFTGILAIILGLTVGILSSFLAFGSWTGSNYSFIIPWLELGALAVIMFIIIILSALYPAYRAANLTPAEALRKVA
jgi:putative ABC transport system permease protein